MATQGIAAFGEGLFRGIQGGIQLAEAQVRMQSEVDYQSWLAKHRAKQDEIDARGQKTPPVSVTATPGAPGTENTGTTAAPATEDAKSPEEVRGRGGLTAQINDEIKKAAAQHNVDPSLLTGVLSIESNFNPKAVNKESGAQGIAQIMPENAAKWGIDPFDPAQAIPRAAQYLREGLDKGNGDVNYALKYYYGGPNEKKWGPRTQAYPGSVLARARQFGPGVDPSAYEGVSPSTLPAMQPGTSGDFPGASPTPTIGPTEPIRPPPAPPRPAVAPAPAALAAPPAAAGEGTSSALTVLPAAPLAVSPAPAPMPPRVTAPGVMPPGGLVTPDDYVRYLGGSGGGSALGAPPEAGGDSAAVRGGATPYNAYNTPLNPREETSFRTWLKNNRVKFNPDAEVTDYDMRGFWRAFQRGDPRAKMGINPRDKQVHYSDYWKTPLHKTFSNESQWATPGAPRWVGQKLVDPAGNVVFEPPPTSALFGSGR